jgi:hypothetical protein
MNCQATFNQINGALFRPPQSSVLETELKTPELVARVEFDRGLTSKQIRSMGKMTAKISMLFSNGAPSL